MLARLKIRARSKRFLVIGAAIVSLAVIAPLLIVIALASLLGSSAAAACNPGGVQEIGMTSGPWTNPVAGTITSGFGMRTHPVTGAYVLHDGTDIGAANGTVVRAASRGVATVSNTTWAGPNTVVVDHGGGSKTVYGHMRRALISSGDQVAAGQPIGEVGSEGMSSGNHLHFTVVVPPGTPGAQPGRGAEGLVVDPIPFMKQHSVTLGTGGGGTVIGEPPTGGMTPVIGPGETATLGEVPTSWTGTASTGEKVTLDQRQMQFAAQVIQKGSQLGVSDDGIVIALMTALVESKGINAVTAGKAFNNYASRVYPETIGREYPTGAVGSDSDSVGIFQQRPQAGWGTPLELMDPGRAAAGFFGGPQGPNRGSPRGLLDIPGWEALPKGVAAQKVQISAFPDRYASWESAATQLLGLLKGQLTLNDAAFNCPAGTAWTKGSARFASLNVLGCYHTDPSSPWYSAGDAARDSHGRWPGCEERFPKELDYLEGNGVSIAAIQEFQGKAWQVNVDQLQSRGWSIWPGSQQGHRQSPVIWKSAEWSLVNGETFPIPYNKPGTVGSVTQVLLRNISTGSSLYVISLHNTSTGGAYGDRARGEAVRLERARAEQLMDSGIPVVLAGDFNEVKRPYCQLRPVLVNAIGEGSTQPCKPPRGSGIDQVYGGGVVFSQTTTDWSLRDRKISDHPAILTTISAPGADATGVSSSGGARKAIEFATTQVGDPYVWGATGPDAWDCSGLMLRAWAAAGVQIPRVSRDQATFGEKVTRAELRPGDLVFYFTPVSHVAMYIGDGKIVHAPRPGKTVEIVPLDQPGPVTGYRRVTNPGTAT